MQTEVYKILKRIQVDAEIKGYQTDKGIVDRQEMISELNRSTKRIKYVIETGNDTAEVRINLQTNQDETESNNLDELPIEEVDSSRYIFMLGRR